MWRTLPCSCSSLKAPSWSASGTCGVDAVQLDEVDPLDLQVPQRELHLLREVGRAPDRRPDAGPRAA